MNSPSRADPGLADALDAARAHADRHFGDGPVPTWQPTRRWAIRLPPNRRQRLTAGALATALLLAAAWRAGEGDRSPMAVPASFVPTAAPDDAGAAPAAAPLPAPPPRPAVGPAANPPVLDISRRGAGWQIHAVGASRLAAAQVLAELSGSTLHGHSALLAATRPLDLHRWQGRSPEQAWQAVLGAELNYALQCDARRCRAWIVDGGTSGAALPPASTGTTRNPAPPPESATTAPAAAMSQSDSDNPRVSSHHD